MAHDTRNDEVSQTNADQTALENEPRRLDDAMPLRERVRPIQDRIMAGPPTGSMADKAYFDELSGDD